MQILKPFELLKHRLISLHVRPTKDGTPKTYWLTITMPWRETLYDITMDEERRSHPRYCFGFRFHRYPGPAAESAIHTRQD